MSPPEFRRTLLGKFKQQEEALTILQTSGLEQEVGKTSADLQSMLDVMRKGMPLSADNDEQVVAQTSDAK